jgi:hypothetical protein
MSISFCLTHLVLQIPLGTCGNWQSHSFIPVLITKINAHTTHYTSHNELSYIFYNILQNG